MNEEEIRNKILELEAQMNDINFWNDKENAQATIKELKVLKDRLEGEAALDKGSVIVSIIPGAGGDDSEDWARMLHDMYIKWSAIHGHTINYLHTHVNDHGGYKYVTFEIKGKNAYGDLKFENGVHRLVRISPFNAQDKRHTSFALVEALPEIIDDSEIEIKDSDIKIDFANAGGPGGQNVNKRETKVILKHLPTNITITVATERDQRSNRELALNMLKAKLYLMKQEEVKALQEGRNYTKTTEIEWGNQIRNYVLHPYKLVKDLRIGYETTDVDKILLKGEIDDMIKSCKSI